MNGVNALKAIGGIALFLLLIPFAGWLFMTGVDFVFEADYSAEVFSWKSTVTGLLVMALSGSAAK